LARLEVALDSNRAWTRMRRPGARRQGLLLGLTLLVSEPSWPPLFQSFQSFQSAPGDEAGRNPPLPDQAWLRIALPRSRFIALVRKFTAAIYPHDHDRQPRV